MSVNLAKRFLAGASWVFAGKVLSACATLAGYALLARILSPDEMGTYFLVFSIVTFLSLFCQWGLNRGLVKIIASELAVGNDGQVKSGLITSFSITFFLGILVALFLSSPTAQWLLSGFSGSQLLVSVTAVAGIWVIIKSLQGLLSESFRGFHDIRMATIFGGLITAVMSTGLYLLIWIMTGEASLRQIVLVMVVASGTSLLTGAIFLLRKMQGMPRTGKFELHKVLSFGFPLLLTSISLIGVRELHLWLLSIYQPETEVALYGSALRLVTLLAMPLIIVNSVIPPMIADLYKKKEYVRVQSVLQKTATLMGVPAVVMFCLIVVFGKEMLALIYGDLYAAAFIPFVVLAGGQLVNVLSGSPGILLTMSGHERFILKSALISGIIGIITTIAGVQVFGAAGAAMGFSAGIIINNLAMWGICAKRLSIRTHGSLTSLKEMLIKLRSRIESDETNGGALGILGKPTAIIELMWWKLCGYEIIECFGDSHAQIFRSLNSMKWTGRRRYRVTSVRGATAYGIGNPNSSTNALQIFTNRLRDIPRERSIIFMLGEVDVGFLIWLRAKKANVPESVCMEEAFRRYTKFLSKVMVDHTKITVCSVQLPTIPDGIKHGNVANARSGIEASQKERTDLTLEFNRMLKKWSRENDADYLDFDKYALDEHTNLVKSSLLNKNPGNHHYDDEAFRYLIKNTLGM